MNCSLNIIGATGKIGRILVPELIRTFSDTIDSIYLPGKFEKEPSSKVHLLAEQCRTIDNIIEVIPCRFEEAHSKGGITVFLADSEINQNFIAESVRTHKPVSRIALGKNNFSILKEYSYAFSEYSGKLLVVSNHVELSQMILQTYSQMPIGNITGLSWNDTLRLRGYISSLFQAHEKISGVAMVGTHDEHAVASILPSAKIGDKSIFSFPHAKALLREDVLEEKVKSFAVQEFLAFKDTATITVKSVVEHMRFLLGKSDEEDFVFSHAAFGSFPNLFFCGMDSQGSYYSALSDERQEKVMDGIRNSCTEFQKYHQTIAYGQKSLRQGKRGNVFRDKESANEYFDLFDLHYSSEKETYYFYLTEFLTEQKRINHFSEYLQSFEQDTAKILSLLCIYQNMHMQQKITSEMIGNSFDENAASAAGKEKCAKNFDSDLDSVLELTKKMGRDCASKIEEAMLSLGKKDEYILACLADAYLTAGNVPLALTTIFQSQQIKHTSFAKEILNNIFEALGKDDAREFHNVDELEKEKTGIYPSFRDEVSCFWYYKYLAFGKSCERPAN